MRKIGTVEQEERRRKINTAIISLFLLFILLAGTVGYGLVYSTDSTNQEIPEGISDVGGQWILRTGNQIFYFTRSPDSVKDVQIDITKPLSSYSGQSLYIDSEDPVSAQQIAQSLGPRTLRIQEACYGSCDSDLPEKDCTENLIVITESETERVYQDQNCIFIEGTTVAVEAFLYKLFGYN